MVSPKKIIVGYFLDDFSSISAEAEAESLGITPEELEVSQMKALFTESLPDREFIFKPVRIELLAKEPGVDVFFYDFGGLSYVDMDGRQREHLTNVVLSVMRDRPNLLIIPYSRMTCRDFLDVVHHEQSDLVNAPNVVTGYKYTGSGIEDKEGPDGEFLILDDEIKQGIADWFSE